MTWTERRIGWQIYAIEQITEKAEKLGDVTSEAQLRNQQWTASIEKFKAAVGRVLGPFSSLLGQFQGLTPVIGAVIAAN